MIVSIDLMRSSRSKQIIAKKMGHAIHPDQPQLVIDTIRQVLKELKRTGGKKVLQDRQER